MARLRQGRANTGRGAAHNLARWTSLIGLGVRVMNTKTLRRRLFSLAGRLTRSARRLLPASPAALALGGPGSVGLWRDYAPCRLLSDANATYPHAILIHPQGVCSTRAPWNR